MIDYKQFREQLENSLKNNDTQSISKILDDLDEFLFINNYNIKKFHQKKYNALVEKLPCGIIIHNSKAKIIFCNSYAQKFLGLFNNSVPEREINDEEWQFVSTDYSILPSEEYPVNKVIQTLVPINDSILGFHNVKTKDTLWCMVNADPEFNENNKLISVIVSFIDITERIKTESALKENEEKFRFLTENIMDVIWIIDVKTLKYNYISPSIVKLRGYTAEEVFNRPAIDAFSNKSKILLKRLISQRLQLFLKDPTIQEIYTDEVEQPCKNGLTVWTEIISYFRINPQTQRTEIIGTSRNITERKAAEEEIRKLSTAITQSPAAIVITDVEGTINYVNPQFTVITGYTSEEAIGENPRILNSGKMPDEIFKDLWVTISSGNTWKGELLNKRKDGTFFWETAIIAPIKDEKGAIINYLAVKEDITSRKEAEEALMFSQSQLREAIATRDKFFSIIAHDLKNPFNIILGFSDLLLQNHKEYDLETRESVIRNLYDTSLKTFNLLENLLAWSRSKSGNIPFNPKSIEIKLIAYDSIGLFKEAAEKKNVKLNLYCPEDIYVFADRDMVAAILRNFINNAIKFTERDGKISVTIKEPENDYVQVSIKDSGIGIKRDKLKILFNIDRNWNTPGTEDEAGTGLGLFLCKEFIKKNGGKIWVESIVGKGTEFFFTIPSPK